MKRIELTRGKFAIVDDEDFKELNKFKWSASSGDSNCYALKTRKINGHSKTISMHGLIMGTPKGLVTDHINHDTLDNRRCNLRVCTNRQNQMNAKLQKNNTSGISGVSYSQKRKKYLVHIRVNGLKKIIGSFTNLFDATCARKSAEIKYFGEFTYKGVVKAVKIGETIEHNGIKLECVGKHNACFGCFFYCIHQSCPMPNDRLECMKIKRPDNTGIIFKEVTKCNLTT